MGSENDGEVVVAGVGVDLYQLMLRIVTSSRSRGGGGGYRRLNQGGPVRKRVRLARLGKRRIRALRMRRLPRLRLRLRLGWFSPFTLLAKLRDAYVKLLQSASHKLSYSDALALGPFPGFPSDVAPFGDLKAKERQMDQVLQLYFRTRPQLLLTNED